MRRILIVLMLAAASCGGEQSAGVESVVKETLGAVRSKELVRVRVRLDRSELPSAEELKLRDRLEDEIAAHRIGAVVGRDANVGWFDLQIEVESTADAVPRVRAILQSMSLDEKSTIEIRQAD